MAPETLQRSQESSGVRIFRLDRRTIVVLTADKLALVDAMLRGMPHPAAIAE